MLITLSRSGRLGNRLQLAAYASAAALECGTTVALLCLGRYRRLFAGSWADAMCRLPPRATPWWTAMLQRLVGLWARLPGIPHLSAPRLPGVMLDEPVVLERIRHCNSLVLDGYYFYAPELLRRHAPAIRRYFQLAPSASGPVDWFLARARTRADRIVGVHIRHGDYARYRGGEHFFATAHYTRLLHQLREALEPASTHFVICSDTPQPPDAFAGLSWERGPGRTVEDLYVLAGCDYVLGPCSTYNRWAAFVGNVPRYEIRDPARAISLDDFQPPVDLTVPV